MLELRSQVTVIFHPCDHGVDVGVFRRDELRGRNVAEPVPEPIKIDSDVMYPREWVLATFGRRWVERLTAAGLRAHSGWYRGKSILAAHETAERQGVCRCASDNPTEEKSIERKFEVQKVAESVRTKRDDPVSIAKRSQPLRVQAAKLRGLSSSSGPRGRHRDGNP